MRIWRLSESKTGTNITIDRVWAAGDVQGWMGGIESANAGGMAAAMIIHDWYPTDTAAA